MEKSDKLKEKISSYKTKHKSDIEKIRNADKLIQEKETEIVALQSLIKKYESGNGFD